MVGNVSQMLESAVVPIARACAKRCLLKELAVGVAGAGNTRNLGHILTPLWVHPMAVLAFIGLGRSTYPAKRLLSV